jgi:hypothetical protein
MAAAATRGVRLLQKTLAPRGGRHNEPLHATHL